MRLLKRKRRRKQTSIRDLAKHDGRNFVGRFLRPNFSAYEPPQVQAAFDKWDREYNRCGGCD